MRHTLIPLAAALTVTGTASLAQDEATEYDVQIGVLTCESTEGGWNAVIASNSSFACSYDAAEEGMDAPYDATIRQFGIDLGNTSNEVLQWAVVAPSATEADEWEPASLAGTYAGVGAEATVGAGVGAKLLVGGGDQSFALQPLSGQTQEGLNIAAAVQTLDLDYTGG